MDYGRKSRMRNTVSWNLDETSRDRKSRQNLRRLPAQKLTRSTRRDTKSHFRSTPKYAHTIPCEMYLLPLLKWKSSKITFHNIALTGTSDWLHFKFVRLSSKKLKLDKDSDEVLRQITLQSDHFVFFVIFKYRSFACYRILGKSNSLRLCLWTLSGLPEQVADHAITLHYCNDIFCIILENVLT